MNDRSTSALVLDDGVVWPEDAVEVGRIVDAWGVKGGIKVMPFSSDPQALFCTKKWFLRPAEQAAGALSRPSAKTGEAGTSVVSKAAAPKAAAHARLAAPRFLQMKTVREQGDIIVGTAEGLGFAMTPRPSRAPACSCHARHSRRRTPTSFTGST